MSSSPPSKLTHAIGPAAVHRLPFDIIHTLLDFAVITDILSLCSTCSALQRHLKNDSIWKRVNAFHGLRDLTHFGGASPYTVYTRLIHPYGPIIGLWAGDHPFIGGVLELRLIEGDEQEQGGIVGEAWSFPTPPPDSLGDDYVSPPSYVHVVKISFEQDEAESAEDLPPTKARVFCDTGPGPNGRTRHPASLILRGCTLMRPQLQFYRHTADLPDFPRQHRPWLDDDDQLGSRLPRIPQIESEPEFSQRSIVDILPASRLPILWVSESKLLKPNAISIRCSTSAVAGSASCPCAAHLTPTLPFPSLDTRLPRYYPLKSIILPSVDPHSPAWHAGTLAGLWYGSYGLQGIEVLHISWKEDRPLDIIATKITGDAHVPRGSLSWILKAIPEENMVEEDIRAQWAASQPDEEAGGQGPVRLMWGQGIMAGSGFRDVGTALLMAGVFSADEIQIFWSELHDFRTYLRYKGREEDVADMYEDEE